MSNFIQEGWIFACRIFFNTDWFFKDFHSDCCLPAFFALLWDKKILLQATIEFFCMGKCFWIFNGFGFGIKVDGYRAGFWYSNWKVQGFLLNWNIGIWGTRFVWNDCNVKSFRPRTGSETSIWGFILNFKDIWSHTLIRDSKIAQFPSKIPIFSEF